MSSANTSIEEPIPSKPATITNRGLVSWIWVVIACALLGASGAVRAVQDRSHQYDRAYKEVCPINLATLPVKFDQWELIKGGEAKLDDLTMRITGGSDHLIRTYANNLTGVSLMVLILYGPAEPVLPHTPKVCYPSSGFSQGDQSSDRMIDYVIGKDAEGQPIKGQALFQQDSYFKPAGRIVIREAVYHSFRLDGQWSPYIGMGRKFPRRNPGIFKIQVQRKIAEGETLGQGDPIEQFLALFLAEIEGSIKTSSTKGLAAK